MEISKDLIHKMNQYWMAANYLSVGQIYLLNNPLLREPLKLEHIKPRLLGHWGTSPGLSFIYVHLNRIIKESQLEILFITGPGHGAPAIVANTYLEGTYSELYPNVSQDISGMQKLFKQFSFPGGIPSHTAPQTPGSINEGGELGYSLAHAFGAAFDNPNLLVACVIGDGEAETGPLSASWHSHKFLNAARDGAVLPILHLNGYKIAGPTVLGRMPDHDLRMLFQGYGYNPHFVEGYEPMLMHEQMAETLDHIISEIHEIQRLAREENSKALPKWPLLILRSPKGWTGPKMVDGEKTEDFWRSHQVPIMNMTPDHIQLLEAWLKSYHPEHLFDENGTLLPELAALAPAGNRRMGANPHANGGVLLKNLNLPDYQKYAVDVSSHGQVSAQATEIMGEFLRDVMTLNKEQHNFRVMGPDETASNRLSAIFEATDRTWMERMIPEDVSLSPNGRVMEILSEHVCQGWLEGYLLTGRHGLFSCYEAFIHIVDSMFNQHAKWLESCKEVAWRKPIASLNILLTSHVWRQDHNGFSHQDPGFIDVVVNKSAKVVRVYFPPDANTLLSVTNHCLLSRNYINVIVAGKQPELQWLDMDEANKHSQKGIGVWEWASNDQGTEPDVVMACCGDVPTLETLAAVQLLRELIPDLKIRTVNVLDLMKLQPPEEHPHGLSYPEFDAIFTTDKPIIFAYHGYPWIIHRLTYRRTNHNNLHVRGYKEKGTTTTPFDMVVLNDLDRFHLVKDVVERVPKLKQGAPEIIQFVTKKLAEHKQFIEQYGIDMPEIQNWQWKR